MDKNDRKIVDGTIKLLDTFMECNSPNHVNELYNSIVEGLETFLDGLGYSLIYDDGWKYYSNKVYTLTMNSEEVSTLIETISHAQWDWEQGIHEGLYADDSEIKKTLNQSYALLKRIAEVE